MELNEASEWTKELKNTLNLINLFLPGLLIRTWSSVYLKLWWYNSARAGAVSPQQERLEVKIGGVFNFAVNCKINNRGWGTATTTGQPDPCRRSRWFRPRSPCSGRVSRTTHSPSTWTTSSETVGPCPRCGAIVGSWWSNNQILL